MTTLGIPTEYRPHVEVADGPVMPIGGPLPDDFKAYVSDLEKSALVEALKQEKPVAQKFDGGKPRMELLPPELLIGVSKVLTFGAQKYSAGNWAQGDGFHWSRLYGALLRHMTSWANGEDIDPESGLSHLYHAGCMLAFLAAHMERGLGTDDRKAIGIQPNGEFPR